eukprot:gene23222-biopygen1242
MPPREVPYSCTWPDVGPAGMQCRQQQCDIHATVPMLGQIRHAANKRATFVHLAQCRHAADRGATFRAPKLPDVGPGMACRPQTCHIRAPGPM